MTRKQKKVSKTSTFLKVLLVLLVCGGTIAASVGIMFLVAEFTGWYILWYGVIIALVRYEFTCIWGIDNIRADKANRRRRRNRKAQMG